MEKIYKYELQPIGEQTISMPKGAEVLSVIEQNGKIIVYAIVNVDEEEVSRKFCVLGTGWDAEDVMDNSGYIFLGTVKVGMYVWHVFDDIVAGRM